MGPRGSIEPWYRAPNARNDRYHRAIHELHETDDVVALDGGGLEVREVDDGVHIGA